jgi:hypothetical protein
LGGFFVTCFATGLFHQPNVSWKARPSSFLVGPP